MKILIDSNVLLDVFTEDTKWFEWSSQTLSFHAERDQLFINPLIYAEVSLHFPTIEELDDALPADSFTRIPLPWDAGFLAGRCFLRYRSQGGAKRSPMPDFYIGAHASLEGMTLMTRDDRRFKTYFPNLRLITPAA